MLLHQQLLLLPLAKHLHVLELLHLLDLYELGLLLRVSLALLQLHLQLRWQDGPWRQ